MLTVKIEEEVLEGFEGDRVLVSGIVYMGNRRVGCLSNVESIHDCGVEFMVVGYGSWIWCKKVIGDPALIKSLLCGPVAPYADVELDFYA
jgi:hypothetical protein